MANPFEDPNADYIILINHEGQYSLWPTFREVPAGWSPTGPRAKRDECLTWINEHWTDMRPLSLVNKMEENLGRQRRS
jgi:MbtH protein